MTDDLISFLNRSARRHGWTESPPNRLSYYNVRYTRPEPNGRLSVLLIRVKHRIVDVQTDIGGVCHSYTMPTRHHIEEILSGPVPKAAHDDVDLHRLEQAVDNWESGLDHHGHNLATAAAALLRKIKGDNDVRQD